MTREHLHTIYSNRIDQFAAAIRKETGRLNLISAARLFSLVTLIWMVVLGIKHQESLFYGIAFLMLVLFLVLVTKHNKHRVIRDLLRQQQSLNETEQSCLNHEYQSLPDG